MSKTRNSKSKDLPPAVTRRRAAGESLIYSNFGVPQAEKGLGTDTVWFSGGRAGAGIAAHGGIEKIIYYGRQPMDRASFFVVDTRSAYSKLFKVYLLIEGKAYRMELNRTSLYPAGYRSHFSVPEAGVEIEHDLVLVNDAVLQTVQVIRNRSKKPLRLRVAWHDYTRKNLDGRTWGPWQSKVAKNTHAVKIIDQAPGQTPAETWFGLVAEKPLSMRITHSSRRYFETSVFHTGPATVAVLFAYDRKSFARRANELRRKGSNESKAAIIGWEKRVREVPKLSLDIPAVESFFRLSPLILESVMPADLPGAMRASAGTYWVWGWDTLVHFEAYLAAGQYHFVRDTLGLYHRTAHPTEGIGHQFDINLKLKISQAPAAQGLYPYALYQYVAYTGDRAVLRKHYPLVLTILKLALKTRHKTGLFSGRALYPDFPEFAGHNGHDISVFNNSVFYQAARAIEHLAGWMGDAATARVARKIWQDLKKSFHLFWDAKRGFWVDSIDNRTLVQRRSHTAHAILCFSPFARELLEGREDAIAGFMAKNHAFSGGIRMYPVWDPCFNGDGNQFGQHYPVGSDLLFLRTGAATGRQAILKQWLGWVEQFWNQNTVPEGVTVEAENEGPLYPDCPGGKQPFSGKAWYMGILNSLVGVYFDAGGLTFGPGLDRTVEVNEISFGGRRWNIRTRGTGRYIHRVRVNGADFSATCKLPADATVSKTVRVDIERGTKPLSRPQLLSADGAKLSRFKADQEGFQARLEYPGSIYVRVAASRKPIVAWRGNPVPVAWNQRKREGAVLLASDDFRPASGLLRVEASSG